MKYHEFIDWVQGYADDEALDVVVRATRVVLSVMGSVIAESERRRLGSQLPAELRNALLERERMPSFDLEEFYNRVSARASIGYPRAVLLSQAVVVALRRALTERAVDELRGAVPRDWSELFDADLVGPPSPST